ncbi:MAG: squalene/phytoene synthase family protein [Sphingomicrobium sp.]
MAERRLDSDREIALEQLPREIRPAFSALWNLDLAFADVVATSSDPRLGAIRLAWWRERIEELEASGAPPAEPRLVRVVSELLSRRIGAEELSQLEDAWLPLLEAFPWGERQAAGLKLRGRILFGVGARLLCGEPSVVNSAGELWSLVDGARHCSDAVSRKVLRGEARSLLERLPKAVPRNLRRLTVLGAIAARDLLTGERAAKVSPWRRFGAALRHGALGTFPRG